MNCNINSKEKELIKYSITFKKFLNVYFGISDESLKDVEMTHQDIKRLFPELERINFEKVYSNMDILYTGEVIIIRDCNNDFAPYLRPEFKVLSDSSDIVFSKESKVSEPDVDINSLKLYELKRLCKQLKRVKKYKEYRKVIGLLRAAKDSSYKLEKRKLREEGENEYKGKRKIKHTQS